MPCGFGVYARPSVKSVPKVGRPKRDRAKVKAGRRAARQNR